jgi:hypothetical protein
MTPSILLAVGGAITLGVLFLAIRRGGRMSSGRGTVDAGAVSTRWLSELRRDEPWTRL